MININEYCLDYDTTFADFTNEAPWNVIAKIQPIITAQVNRLSTSEYIINGEIAIHRTATIEQGVVLKGPVIISEECFIGAHAYLRGGVFIGQRSVVGPGCEVKSSVILNRSALAHFNFVGDTLVGSNVNMEAGSVTANHFNERADKTISVKIHNTIYRIDSMKFGAIIGDNTKIGANAVLSPGTILPKHSIVRRLELIDQCA
jgi:UDP-N-acetylglucosamine diphosphorylase / glucose-1-phosphate thymidylyltransferase / UDP-N-acetylgalactosamine diphosphorylase / glucosamine-1-phosphate N-acetyltransferase / galactosamine-1-phosphate N-acetyltransferase